MKKQKYLTVMAYVAVIFSIMFNNVASANEQGPLQKEAQALYSEFTNHYHREGKLGELYMTAFDSDPRMLTGYDNFMPDGISKEQLLRQLDVFKARVREYNRFASSSRLQYLISEVAKHRGKDYSSSTVRSINRGGSDLNGRIDGLSGRIRVALVGASLHEQMKDMHILFEELMELNNKAHQLIYYPKKYVEENRL